MAGRRVDMTHLDCERCGKGFDVYPHRIAAAVARGETGPRFCSLDCYNAARRVGCKNCGATRDRGDRALCSACFAASPAAQDADRARKRLAECPPGLNWCRECDRFMDDAAYGDANRKGTHICVPCLSRVNRDGHLQRTYGISQETYDALLEAQGGVCGICGCTPRKQQLHIDHDHKTGVIRGLLCRWCNHRLLGGARESVQILQAAAAYLSAPPAVDAVGVLVVPPAPKKRKTKKAAAVTVREVQS